MSSSEKINDNAYKLELPADFGVSPTFNIADLKPYLGEEDELPSRMTSFQEGEDDEDINTIVTPTAPAAIHTGPIMMRTSIPLLHPQPLLLHILDQLLELAHAN